MKKTWTTRVSQNLQSLDQEDQLKRETNALYTMLSGMVGADKLILKAGKLEALTLLRSRKPEERVLGLQRVIYENPAIVETPALEDIPTVLQELYDELADQTARRAVEDSIERKVAEKMQEKHEEYIMEVKRQLVKEQGGPESPQTLKKFAQLEKMKCQKLNRSAMDILRPQSLDEIVGQEAGVQALMAKLASPYPQHMIIYGPPGVGKTTAARLALEAAKKLKQSAFHAEAPFVEVDGTTLRWDPRETTNPLLGSVHDPIYQGAKRDLVDGSVPEPKPGLVTEAHSGILFIDEIGELDLHLQSKLLKVLEDKNVKFDSAYYDSSDSQVPQYIRKLFEEGAPADFVLIGATTCAPEEINPALRSRCTSVFFEPLTSAHIEEIAAGAAVKLEAKLESGVARTISEYTTEGRQAVNLVSDAFGLALYRQAESDSKEIIISREIVMDSLRSGRHSPNAPQKNTEGEACGRVFGLGVSGYHGGVLEIEAISFPARQPGKGAIRFNETAGSMARDSVFNAAAVIRRITGEDLQDYDLHVNVIGGGRIDGPSAGLAVVIALISAIKDWPVRQNVAVTGEVSLQGYVRPVGGIPEKIYGARLSGMPVVLVPQENKDDVPKVPDGMQVIPVATVEEALPWFFGETAAELVQKRNKVS
ncbi:Lon family ATP-dependent protease [Dethiobacter alkaliphilus]|uniref:Lon family ATP-dependent protease n=1 Tax=Dethiobacter alkaliphilus TaxID=427926 RepID=UPI002226E542|nr:Lon family ATP-dependent protease [Dethiobacter alkaliphilus]MCW3488951.1 Lon family ATP-dependent protease [Dethiobacter alkaliphilus]